MWRSKKFILVVALVAVVVVGSISGVALAQDENGDDSGSEYQGVSLWDRAFEIYQQKTGVTIDSEALKDAFAEAQDELRITALQDRLANLVEQGRITQEQADELLKWEEARPDVTLGPDVMSGFGFPGHGGFRGMGGMGGMRGFGGPCAPTETE
jgi:hypothetical protein